MAMYVRTTSAASAPPRPPATGGNKFSRNPSTSSAVCRPSLSPAPPGLHRKLDLTKVLYNPTRTQRAMEEEQEEQRKVEEAKKAGRPLYEMPKLFQPEVNDQREGAQFSYNGKKCDVFEHLYQEGIEGIKGRVMLASPASFREQNKMWQGIKDEPRDPKAAARHVAHRNPWVAAGSPQSYSTSRSQWRAREKEILIEEEVRRKQRAASAPRPGVCPSLARPTSSSQAKAQTTPRRSQTPKRAGFHFCGAPPGKPVATPEKRPKKEETPKKVEPKPSPARQTRKASPPGFRFSSTPPRSNRGRTAGGSSPATSRATTPQRQSTPSKTEKKPAARKPAPAKEKAKSGTKAEKEKEKKPAAVSSSEKPKENPPPETTAASTTEEKREETAAEPATAAAEPATKGEEPSSSQEAPKDEAAPEGSKPPSAE